MEGIMFLSFVLSAVIGVALLAFGLKFLDLQGQAVDQEEGKRISDSVPPAETVAANMPAFFGRPHASRVPRATLAFDDRLPTLREIDHRHILWALDQAGGHHAQAALLLGTTESTFDGLVERHCGSAPKAGRRVEAPLQKPEPWTTPSAPGETVDDRLFAFIQSHIQAEQAVVSEFVHLPSIDSLYRQARPTLTMR